MSNGSHYFCYRFVLRVDLYLKYRVKISELISIFSKRKLDVNDEFLFFFFLYSVLYSSRTCIYVMYVRF